MSDLTDMSACTKITSQNHSMQIYSATVQISLIAFCFVIVQSITKYTFLVKAID